MKHVGVQNKNGVQIVKEQDTSDPKHAYMASSQPNFMSFSLEVMTLAGIQDTHTDAEKNARFEILSTTLEPFHRHHGTGIHDFVSKGYPAYPGYHHFKGNTKNETDEDDIMCILNKAIQHVL